MMRSLTRVKWTLFCLFVLWEKHTAVCGGVRCPGSGPGSGPVGRLHPVRAQLERFDAGQGCSAREPGSTETHVVAVGRVSHSQDNKVKVLLKPLSPSSSSPLRSILLLLSSRFPVSWHLEAESLPSDFPVQIQVSSNSSVQSDGLQLSVRRLNSMPFRPRALHRWALKHHGNISSLTHAAHGNRVYVRLGEDPTAPPVCLLQPVFLSHNYLTSDLQPQEVQGCSAETSGGRGGPEVHIIKLHSAGSGLCGSLQVEVIVSLLPPLDNSLAGDVVLILSSSVAVNWAIAGRGVRGHVTVHASNSVSPPFPAEPSLTLTSSVTSDLSSVPDLLSWAGNHGYAEVASYTEADLANRFVIQLSGGGTGQHSHEAAGRPVASRPSWAEERRMRQWLNGGERARRGGGAGGGGGGGESLWVNCEEGRLSVAVDRSILQSLSVPVSAVTLADRTCRAQSNGSHFLLVFPVISCGTEGPLLREPRRVTYKNTVLLWSEEPRPVLTLNQTEKSKSPISIHFSCSETISRPHVATDDRVNASQTGLVPWALEGSRSYPISPHLPSPRLRSGPVLFLKLFVSESYEQTRVGPCVITAENRVYAEISAEAPFAESVQVESCIISPLSDPKKSPFWTVISDGCSLDPSLTLSTKTKEEEGKEEEEEEGDEQDEEKERTDSEVSPKSGRKRKITKRNGDAVQIRPLRFSFILRPVFNNSMQFLHCSLRVCVSNSGRRESMKEKRKNDCQEGLNIPPIVSRLPGHQCEIRNLSRPMVVTQSISSLLPKSRSLAGQRTKRLSVVPTDGPEPEDSTSVEQNGPLMGIVFAALVLAGDLVGVLWCLYSHKVAQRTLLRVGRFTDETNAGNTWNPTSLSEQSSSSV